MRTILTLILAAMTYISANAYKYSYSFKNTPISEAIVRIGKDHPDVNIFFIYKELEDYKTSASINTDNIYQALRQTIGVNPVSIINKGNHYYIEALQHGKFNYTGNAIGNDNEPVAGASVMLLTPRDSTFITYGVTDSNGHFSIPCDKKNILAKFSCVGYKTTYIDMPSFAMGTITMQLSPIQLSAVSIEADELMVGHDKIMLNVSKNLQKHSHDGYSLLNIAMIPGLEVDPFEHTVKSENQNVLLCINGIEATQGDIKTLNPRDVTRIDFYTGYDPRHPDSRFTVDFIVKIRDFGGAVVFDATQYLNRPTGSDMADWRMFHGKTEFGARIEENFDSYAKGKTEEGFSSLSFDSGDVTISSTDFVNRNRNQSFRVKPYIVYRKNKETLKLTFALQRQHTRQNNTDFDNYIRLSDVTNSKADITTHSDRTLPSMSGMYQHKYNNTSYLNIFFNGNYSHTNNFRDYSSLEQVISHTNEDFFGGSATVQYSFGLTDKQKGFISAGGGANYSKIKYDENMANSISRLTTSYFRFAIGDNWRISRSLGLYFMLGAEIANTDNNHNESTQFTLIPNLNANWTIAKGNTLNCNFSIRSERPPMSYYSPNEKWIMPYLRVVGNPDLKMSRTINTNLTYRNVKKWGYLELYGSLASTSRSVYYDFRCDNSRDVYIQTFRNGRTFYDVSAGTITQFKIVPQHLTFRVGGEWSFVRTVTYRPLHRHTFRGNANLMFTSGGFTANLACSTPAKTLNELGAIGFVPWMLRMSINYDINNWNMGVTLQNPFMTTPTRSSAELPGITESNKFYSSRIRYNMVALTVGYRFSYGKPKKNYENVELHENENSAILGF